MSRLKNFATAKSSRVRKRDADNIAENPTIIKPIITHNYTYVYEYKVITVQKSKKANGTPKMSRNQTKIKFDEGHSSRVLWQVCEKLYYELSVGMSSICVCQSGSNFIGQ